MISVVLCTKRSDPGFEAMADSFANALGRGVEFGAELIVVDGCLNTKIRDSELRQDVWADSWRRRQKLANAIQGRFSYRHISPKPTAWQGQYRKTRRDYYDLNNARNTGIALARGHQVALVDDCSVLDPEYFVYQQRMDGRIAMAGSFRSYTKAKIVNGKIVEGELHPCGIDSRGEITRKAPGGWLWGLNVSFPLDWALKINGYDELYAGQGGSEDCDFGVRLERAGCTIVYEPRCLVYQILENHEAVCDIATWGDEQKIPQKEKLLRDGKMHFANELLIQDLLDDSQRTRPRGNDFDLRKLREEALANGNFPTERAVTLDWRDGKLLEEM